MIDRSTSSPTTAKLSTVSPQTYKLQKRLINHKFTTLQCKVQPQYGFPPLCPDLVVVVELASPSDGPQARRRKMAAYMANGASFGWLLLPQSRTVEVWQAGAAETANSPLVLSDPAGWRRAPSFRTW